MAGVKGITDASNGGEIALGAVERILLGDVPVPKKVSNSLLLMALRLTYREAKPVRRLVVEMVAHRIVLGVMVVCVLLALGIGLDQIERALRLGVLAVP